MSIKLQVILLIVLFIVLLFLIRQVKHKKLDLKYTLSWFLLLVALILMVFFPNLLVSISNFLGIYSPVNMIFFCGFIFALVIIYTLTIAISKMASEIKRLAQKIAILEKGEQKDEEQ